jgi:two-component sensor histidine kinase
MFDSSRIVSLSEAADLASKTKSEESNHRIANNLALVSSLVRMKANAVLKRGETLMPEDAAAMLKEVAQRIEGVSKLHRLLASSSAQDHVVAASYLSEVCNGVAGSFAEQSTIAFRDYSEGLALPPERLNALGLFLAEGLTNAYKYSHPAGAPGRIEVTFAVRDCGIRLTVQDDGVGLPEGFNPQTDGGLGLRIMRSLSEQLGGAMSVKSNPLGLRVGLEAPQAAKPAPAG